MPGARVSQPLHLVDATRRVDPLRPMVQGPDDPVLNRRMDTKVLRWRAARDVALRTRQVIAWGSHALDVARRAEIRSGIFRPDSDPPPGSPPPGQWHAAVATRHELDRLAEQGWVKHRLHLVPPPDHVPGGLRDTLRAALGLGDQYLWLLPASSGPGDGMRQAVWSAAAVHLATRPIRATKLLVWGDEPGHRRAQRLIDQLGIPGLIAPVRRLSFPEVVTIADAFVFLPQRCAAHCPWSAVLARRAGLPGVARDNPVLRELLGVMSNVRFVMEPGYRPIMREMLDLVETGAGRSTAGAWDAEGSAVAAWQGAMGSAFR